MKRFISVILCSMFFIPLANALSPVYVLDLKTNYPQQTPIEIKVTNPSGSAMTFNETGQCHRFFKIFDTNNNQVSTADPLALCTQEFRSITVPAGESRILDTWDQQMYTYCPPNANCILPPKLQVAAGVYSIEIYPDDKPAIRQSITIDSGTAFSDVSVNHWAFGYINNLYLQGIVNGYGDGRFGPENSITKAEVVKIALKSAQAKNLLLGATKPANFVSPFKDVPTSSNLAPYINQAVQLGIIQPSTYFYPNRAATRYESLEILLNAFQLQTDINAFAADSSVNAFSDTTANMAPYAGFAREQGIVSGVENKFYPNQPISRAEIAKIASNLIAN